MCVCVCVCVQFTIHSVHSFITGRSIIDWNASNLIQTTNSNQSYKYSPHYAFIQTQELMWKLIWEKPLRCSSSGMRKVTSPCSMQDRK